MSDWSELGMEGRTFVSEFCLLTSEMRSLCSKVDKHTHSRCLLERFGCTRQ